MAGFFNIFRLYFDRVFGRFLLSALCCLALLSFYILQDSDSYQLVDDYGDKIPYILVLGYFWFLSSRLFCESHEISTRKCFFVSVLLFTLLAAFIVIFPVFVTFAVAVALSVLVAPFLGKQSDDDLSFWYYNYRVALCFFQALIASSLIVVVSLLLIFIATHFFGSYWDFQLYLKIFLYATGSLLAIYFLSGIPVTFDAREGGYVYPEVFLVASAFLLVPIVILAFVAMYSYIIYLYFTNLVVPEDNYLYAILAASLLAVFCHISMHPDRANLNKFLKACYDYVYLLLLPVILFFLYALWQKISQYGVVEETYLLTLLGLWLFTICVSFVFNNMKHIKFVPLLLMFLLMFASFGPWGVNSVTISSQIGLLKEVLEKNDMLIHGKYVTEKKYLIYSDKAKILNVVNYLSNKKETAHLDRLLKGDTSGGEAFLSQLGISADVKPTSSQIRDFNIKAVNLTNSVRDISDYQYWSEFLLLDGQESSKQLSEESGNIKVELNSGIVSFWFDKKDIGIGYDLRDYAFGLIKKGEAVDNYVVESPEEAVIDVDNEHYYLKILVHDVFAQISKKKKISINSAKITTLIRQKYNNGDDDCDC